MIQDELYEVGLSQRQTMFGPAGSDDVVRRTTSLNDKLEEYVTRYCFGDIWQRAGLSYAERSKITVAMLIATGKPHEIRVHLRGALANGVSPLELRELIVHSVLYCGIPAAVEGMRGLTEVLTEHGISLEWDEDIRA